MGWLGSQERPELLPFGGVVSNWTAVPSRQTIEKLKGTLDAVWHLGDIGYADDSFTHHPASFSLVLRSILFPCFFLFVCVGGGGGGHACLLW